MKPVPIFTSIGRLVSMFFVEVGTQCLLFLRIIGYSSTLITHRHLVVEQMQKIGVMSLPLVSVVSVFTGAVAAWQAAYQFEGFGLVSTDILGGAVNAAISIELAPVLTGLVLAGRVGASIAAEIGTMKVTEQIDALETLGIDPVRYLAVPRFTAGWTMLPILVIYSNLIGHLGAYLVAHVLLGLSGAIFFNSVREHFLVHNILAGLIKALVFGGGTALVGCSIGFRANGGAEGVGQATIKAFVYSSAFILVADYILATILF